MLQNHAIRKCQYFFHCPLPASGRLCFLPYLFCGWEFDVYLLWGGGGGRGRFWQNNGFSGLALSILMGTFSYTVDLTVPWSSLVKTLSITCPSTFWQGFWQGAAINGELCGKKDQLCGKLCSSQFSNVFEGAKWCFDWYFSLFK